MLRANEPIKDASQALLHAVKRTHTKLLAITRNKLQALCSPDTDVSELTRLKQLNDRPRFTLSCGERLKSSLMPKKRTAEVRCNEESGRSYWKTGVRENVDMQDVAYLMNMRKNMGEWDDILDD